MIKRVLTLASTAVFLAASAASAGPALDQDSRLFQYGDSIYTWDLETGRAVRVCAVWDGSVSEPVKQAASSRENDPAFQSDPQAGWTIKASAAWDGHVAVFDAAKTSSVLAAAASQR